MATRRWSVIGKEFGNCNCSYGCPCQFNAPPTRGYCEAALGYQIDRGYCGDTALDGLRAGAIYHWPGAVHQGNRTMQLIILSDEGVVEARSDAPRR